MTYQEALGYIHSLKRFVKTPGLARMRELMKRLGDPQQSLSFIHIAGTNGKGSCAAMTSGALRAAGYRTGLYISPYVIDFRERFQVNGEWMGEDDLTRLTERVQGEVLKLEGEGILITEFEFNTALAFLWFLEVQCEIVVLEVGMGGRFDATNIISAPEASVIMAIGLDHTAILGDTPVKIAFEKAGIIKGGPVILYPIQEPEVTAVIMEKCSETGSALVMPSLSTLEILSEDRFGSCFIYGGEEYRVGLGGRHQIYNALTAIETLRGLKRFPVSLRELGEGLSGVRFPARFETLSEHPLTLLDGAHNPQGIGVLAEALKTVRNRPLIGIVGMLADKDYKNAVKTLASLFDAVLAVSVDNPRSANPADILECAQEVCKTCLSFTDLRAAYQKARELAGKDGGVCIAGSLYLAGEMRHLIVGKNEEEGGNG